MNSDLTLASTEDLANEIVKRFPATMIFILFPSKTSDRIEDAGIDLYTGLPDRTLPRMFRICAAFLKCKLSQRKG